MKEQVGNFVIEIDETVTKKEVFHIGDPVKVFEKSYSDKYNVYPGIIVGFAKTDDMAAIEVLYVVDEYSSCKIKRGLVHEGNKELTIAHIEVSEFGKTITNVLESLDNATDDMAAIEVLYAIVKARFELQAAITLRSAFERNFGKAFKLDQPEETKE